MHRRIPSLDMQVSLWTQIPIKEDPSR